ncbi:MAG: hypothetical protein ABIQ52_15155 [Vicinamibacterales bacterium]
MSSEIHSGGDRTETVEQKVDKLSASVDRRFDDVDVALVEQRKYTEFAFDRLAGEMRDGFKGVDGRLNFIDGRLNSIDGRFNSIDGRFNSIDGRFNSIDGRLNRIERKLDQFIDTQSTANALVERRLTALEPPPGSDSR